MSNLSIPVSRHTCIAYDPMRLRPVELTLIPESLPRIFDRSNGKQWDYVFNCGGETKYSQEDEVYKVRSLALSVAVGKEAAKRGVKAFVELSTGMVYKPDSQPSKEGDKVKPWSKIAVFKLEAEEQLSRIEGLVVYLEFGEPPFGAVYKTQNVSRSAKFKTFLQRTKN